MDHLSTTQGSVTLKPIGRHCHLVRIGLLGSSDEHNNPAEITTYIPRLGQMQPVSGKLFYVVSSIDNTAMVLLSESPVFSDMQVALNANGEITVSPNGYPVSIEKCALSDTDRVVRRYFAERCPMPLFAMLNNWGDGSHGKNINEEFYDREIDAAAEIGADVIQIDDGWQIGSSADSRIFTEDGTYTGYHRFDGDFWTVDRTKFPNGLAPLVEKAAKKGITMGLWFAPDSRDHFANGERDARVLHEAYLQGFRYFKLDMICIRNDEDRTGFLQFVEKVHAFGDDIYLQMDVTGIFPRLGFTDGVGYGKIFVENRYAYEKYDYAPYLTLRNLWQLAKYMPAQRFQFELPNNHRFAEIYDPTDPLAADKYGADYLFASVMVSCPLFWMEAQYYAEEDRKALAPVVSAWKKYREELAQCDIIPIGDLPDGTKATGFLAVGEQRSFLIALTEAQPNELTVTLPENAHILRRLAGNMENMPVGFDKNRVTIRFDKPYQYAFYAIER